MRGTSASLPSGAGFEIGELFSVRLQVLEETLKLLLHRIHLLAHVENDLHAGEIHAEVARQRKNQLESFEIRIGVETRVAFRTRRLQQPFTFVQSQRLRMNAILLRYGADRVCFGLRFMLRLSMSMSLTRVN